MPIRHYLHVLILGCTFAGLAIAFVLHQWFKRIETRHIEVTTNALVLREIANLNGALKGLLVTAEMVIVNGEASLAENAVEQCDTALRVVEELQASSLLMNRKTELEVPRLRLASLRNDLETIRQTSPPGGSAARETVEAFEENSLSLIEELTGMREKGHLAAALASARLKKDREDFFEATVVGALLYVLATLLLGRWAWAAIAHPIQDLTRAASLSMRKDVPFQLMEKGPGEARHLTRTIGEFVHQLEDEVETRTEELRRNATRLEKEIQERIAIEAELHRAKAEADAANEAKGAFLANMSHEMRTPLNAVLGFADLLAETPLNAKQSDFVSVIRSSGDILLTLISDILDFSKIEAGKLELESRAFYLRDCVEESLDQVAPLVARKGIEIKCLIHEDVPVSIVGDEARLRQILLNLVSNAVKFTDHGEVAIDVKRVGVGDAGRAVLRFAVSDTGIGISPEQQKFLFQSFKQLQASTTRRFGGTGLGLAISKRLVALMGGEITVESTPGAGSRFSFTIEAPAGDRKLRPFESRIVPGLENARVLVASHSASLRHSLAHECSRWGLSIVSAGSAGEALALVRAGERFDVMIVSEQMEGACALGCSDKMARPDGSAIPIIAVTRMNQAEPAAASGSFTSFLQLPLKSSTLFDRLLEAAGKGGLDKPRTGGISSGDAQLASEIPLRILVAEDNPVNKRLVNLMLKKLGYKADFAADGQEAVERFFAAENGHDLILMDIQMPELDGFEATQIIRERWRGRESDRPVIIALTANALERDRRRCIDAGMDDFLKKPLKIVHLKDAIVKWAARSGETRSGVALVS